MKNFDFFENFDSQIFEKFGFWPYFRKNFDFNQIFENISILVKIFEKFRF